MVTLVSAERAIDLDALRAWSPEATRAPLVGAPWEEASNLSARDSAVGKKPKDFERIDRRRKRYRRRNGLRRAYARRPELAHLRSIEGYVPRVARCGYVCRTGTVEVRTQPSTDGETGYLAGLEQCSNIWACPVCSARLWARRRADLAIVSKWAKDEGASSWLLTLTLRHRARHDLGEMLRGLALAWSKMQAGRWWQNFKDGAVILGMVRRVEVTWGRRNGWHPHLHVQIFAKGDPSRWAEALAVRWRVMVERALGKRHAPTLERGCDLREHADADRYISDAHLEITDADAKNARRRGRLSIGQLAELVAAGVRADASASAQRRYSSIVKTWGQYVAACRGRRALTWSVGLREAAGLIEDEDQADEQADADDAARSTILATMPGQDWNHVRRSALRICALLEAAEAHDVTALVRAGCDPPEGWQDPAEAWPRETRAG